MYSETDLQMIAEWTGIISQLWDAIGKPPEENRLSVYARQLSIIPLGLLEKAVSRAIRDNGKYQTVPTISAVWLALRKELGDPVDLDVAIDNWIDSRFDKFIIRFEVKNDNITTN